MDWFQAKSSWFTSSKLKTALIEVRLSLSDYDQINRQKVNNESLTILVQEQFYIIQQIGSLFLFSMVCCDSHDFQSTFLSYKPFIIKGFLIATRCRIKCLTILTIKNQESQEQAAFMFNPTPDKKQNLNLQLQRMKPVQSYLSFWPYQPFFSSLLSQIPIIFYYMSSEISALPDQKYKIILIGDCCVGKTSIFWRYIHNETIVDHPLTTMDFRYKTIRLQEREVRLCIWDTAGQEKFRSIVATYFKSCQGVVLVYDQTNLESWQNLKNVWYEMAFKRAPTANFLVLGNKKDLTRTVPVEEVRRWCIEKGIYLVETCALTGQLIDQAFFTLAALIDTNQYKEARSLFTANIPYSKNSETTKQCSDRQSIHPLYKRQKSQSFFLKKVQKPKKREKCCK